MLCPGRVGRSNALSSHPRWHVWKYSFNDLFMIKASLMQITFQLWLSLVEPLWGPFCQHLEKIPHLKSHPQTICSFVECSMLSRNLQMASTCFRSFNQMNHAQYFSLHTKAGEPEILNKEMLPASDTKTAIHIADWQVTLLAMSTISITQISVQDLYLQQHP